MRLLRNLRFISYVLLLSNVVVSPCLAFFSPEKLFGSVASTISSAYKVAKDNTICSLKECCIDKYVQADVGKLRDSLDEYLVGQHIAKQIVVDAIGGHFKNIAVSEKPLVMSLHGSPGTGKNYISEFIVKALYKKGISSDFVHKYLGRIDFPLQSNVEEYKARLVRDIKSAVAKCPKSLFIFDEVEKMPSGLFDSIVSLLDNHAYTKELDFRQSIFIFLSNVAGPEIAKKLKHLLDAGTWREQTTLQDFEQTLEISSYNLDGGLYRSEMIESHVVDHFVPFLPLELRHVENCIRMEYQRLTTEQIDEKFIDVILKEAITFDNTGIFSNNGCKRISKKVEALYYNILRKKAKQDL